MTNVKRIVALILTIAMLISLSCVTVFAAGTLDAVTLNFSVPQVGTEVITPNELISSENEGVLCNVSAVFTGDDIAAAKALRDEAALYDYKENNGLVDTTYNAQEYLLVVLLASYGEKQLSEETTITSADGKTFQPMFSVVKNDITQVYLYLLFTPASSGNSAPSTPVAPDEPALNTPSLDYSSSAADESESFDVEVSYNDTLVEDVIYSVDITWGSMEFTYNPEFVGVWNPATHSYTESAEESWTCGEGANKIVVTNHSNAAIIASFTYQPVANYNNITGAFFSDSGFQNSINHLSLPSAVETTVANAPTGNAFLCLSGELAAGTQNSTKSGSVTITIQ